MSRILEHTVVVLLAAGLAVGGNVGYTYVTKLQADNALLKEQVEVMAFLCNMQPVPLPTPQQGLDV